MKQAARATRTAKTAFSFTEFALVAESLKNLQQAIESLSNRYEEGDRRRGTLNELSTIIATDFSEKLSTVIGSDFLECVRNATN